jgi:peptidyl-prolyl cis-trans isomerase SurA
MGEAVKRDNANGEVRNCHSLSMASIAGARQVRKSRPRRSLPRFWRLWQLDAITLADSKSGKNNAMKINSFSATIAVSTFALLGSAMPLVAQPAGNTALEDASATRNSDPRLRKAAAMVNGVVVTDLDVDQRLALVTTASGGRIPKEEMQRLRAQILRNLIDEKLQIGEARQHDVEVDEAQVLDAFNRVATNFKQTPEQFDAFLKNAGTSRQSLLDQIRAEFAWSRLLRRRVEPFINVGDNEVNSIIKNMEANKGQDEYRLGEIFLPATTETEADVTTQANNIASQIRAGASFVAYARQYSQSATAALGGDRGWVRSSQLNPLLRDAVSKATPGSLVGPIRAPGGIFLMVMAEKRKMLAADPLDATVTVKQISVPLAKDKSRTEQEKMVQVLAKQSKVMTGCGRASDLAASLGGKATDLAPQKIRNLPQGLHKVIADLQIGQSTPPFGTENDARVLMLCGRDEAQESLPSFDEVYAQINEERISLMARRYMRDLRRDAIVDYR